MNGDSENYWVRAMNRRYTRRTVLRGFGLAGAGLASASVLACGSSKTNTSTNSSTTRSSTNSKASSAPSGTAAASSTQGSAASGFAALIGRTGTKPTGQPRRGGTYVDAIAGNPATLDPQTSGSSNTAAAVSPVMSRLLQFKTTWDVKESYQHVTAPDLALSLESPDALTWTAKLRTDATWHNIAPVNGRPVVAEDIKVTYTRALSPTGANRGQLGMIDPSQIETPDDHTVIFKLKYAYAILPILLASGIYGWIYPREIANGGYDPTKTLIGSGPFLLDKYTPDVELAYKRNPNWYDKSRPYVDVAKHAIVPDPNQRLAQFKAGNIDYLGDVSQNNLPTVKQQNPNAEVITTWGPGDGQMYFSLGPDSTSPLKDIRMRHAISLAFDRDALSKVAFQGKSEPDFYSPHSFGNWSLTMQELPADTAQWYKFDLTKAKQLLSQAGGDKLNIKLLSPTPFPPNGEAPWFKAMRETVYAMLKALPWQIQLVEIDYNKDWVAGGKGVRYGNFSGDSIVWAGLEGRNSVYEYLFSWYDSNSTANLEHLHDAQLDSMLAKAATIVDNETRRKLLIETQKYMAAQMFSVAGNPNGLVYDMVGPKAVNYLLGDAYGSGTGTWANVWMKS